MNGTRVDQTIVASATGADNRSLLYHYVFYLHSPGFSQYPWLGRQSAAQIGSEQNTPFHPGSQEHSKLTLQLKVKISVSVYRRIELLDVHEAGETSFILHRKLV